MNTTTALPGRTLDVAATTSVSTVHTAAGRRELIRTLMLFKREFTIVGLLSAAANLLMLTPTLYMLQVYDRVMGQRIRFFEACAEGVMCPIGRGVLDYDGIREALREIGYQGYITVEQERDPRNSGSVLSDVKASRDFLRSVGFN